MAVENGSPNGLHRRLGLTAATLSGVGVILGAGIYVLVGVAAGRAGNAVWLSFVLAALGAVTTGTSYARLSRLRPKDAPEFHYVSSAFGRKPAFLAGWLVLWATIISAAAVALGFGGYLYHLTGFPALPAAIGLVVFSAAIVFIGIAQSAILAGVLTLLEAAGLLFIVGIGLPHLSQVNLLEMPQGMAGVIGAASLVFFAYVGFESMANLSEEMRDPERDLPRAIFLAMGITTTLYILVALSAVSVLGWSDLSQSAAPLAAVAQRAQGSGADLILTFIALSSTANTVLLLLLASSRSMWALSCAGVLPGTFCVIGSKRRTPWATIILVSFFASLFAGIRSIERVAEASNFALLVAFVGVNAAAIKILGQRTKGKGAKRAILNIGLPGLGIGASLFMAANTGWKALGLGALLLATGLAVCYVKDAISRR